MAIGVSNVEWLLLPPRMGPTPLFTPTAHLLARRRVAVDLVNSVWASFTLGPLALRDRSVRPNHATTPALGHDGTHGGARDKDTEEFHELWG